jgi:arylsulfatase A-like enzyme
MPVAAGSGTVQRVSRRLGGVPGEQEDAVSNGGFDRRAFLAGGAAGAGGLLAAPAASASHRRREQRGRPNILWFLSDDAYPYIGAYGDPVARTPTIDRLAAEGIRYESAYCDAPVCAPSRFTLITGLHSATAGPAHNMRAIAKMPSYVRGWPEFLRQAGYYTLNNAKTDYNAQIDLAATWNESSPQAHWRKRPPGTPFFAQFTTLTSHESSVFNHRPGQTRPEDVRIPAFLPDTPTTRADKAQYYDRIAQMDGELAIRLAELEADGLAEDTIVFYFSDNGGVLPWSKRFANERGLRVPLIVRVPEKWSDLAPAGPGSVIEAPIEFADLPPTAMTLAGLRPPEYMQGTPFLGHRRQRQEERYTYGQRSRMDERYDLQRTVRDERYVYIRNYMPHRPYGQSMGYMWQQKGYQEWEQRHLDGDVTPLQERFWDEKPSEELYDVWRDRDQVRNLVGEERHGGTLRRLRRALDEHLIETNDNGFIPEGSPLEGYEESRVPGAYPLRRVMRVAETAIERDPDNLEALVGWLADEHDVIRYWAAQGILMLEDAGQPAVGALTERLEDDPSTHVRVVVAEALARLGHSGRPVAFLAETIDTHESPRVRLLALNAFTYVGVAALPYMDVVERAATSGDEYIRNAGRYLRFVLTGTYTPSSPVFGGF